MTATATGVDALLERARIGLRRLDPHETRAAVATGALLIDTRTDRHIVVVCRQGYSSSLAAASLRAIGMRRATDMAGGVEAWLAAGLATTSRPADIRE